MDRAGKIIHGLKIPGGCLPPEALVRAAWPQAVGKRIAAHTRPVALVSARLIVEVEDAIWQRQLETMCGQILPRLRDLAGKESVAALDFRVGVPRREPQRAGQARAKRDDADLIADPVLRSVYKAARKRSLA